MSTFNREDHALSLVKYIYRLKIMIEIRKNVQAGETPPEISVMQIDQDLKDGISKSEMAIKYSIKPWEVDEMFKHPFLKGRRPSRKKALSFTFVDDAGYSQALGDDEVKSFNEKVAKERAGAFKQTFADAQKALDPNQVTLEDAIDEAIDTVKEVKSQMQETEKAIVELLSPTEYETPEETLLKASSTVEDAEEEKTTPESWGENQELKPIEVKEDNDSSFAM
jgi:uncharacterized protein YukE